MTYLALTVPFLVVAALAAIVAVHVVGRGVRDVGLNVDRRRLWVAVAVTVAVLVVLTAVFDSIMIAAGLFYYDPEHLAGPLIGLAPIEDFAYPIAVAIMLPGLWWFLTRRRT